MSNQRSILHHFPPPNVEVLEKISSGKVVPLGKTNTKHQFLLI